MIEIKKANSAKDFKKIEKLASEILHEVYDPIIPSEHTAYFLKEFQTKKAIENQIISQGFNYYLLNFKGMSVGYLGIQKQIKSLNLSKLYILKSFRGNKIGKKALKLVNEFAMENNFKKIDLTVNQQNKNTIDIYKKDGFKIVDALINSFPNGHSVADYKMEKELIPV